MPGRRRALVLLVPALVASTLVGLAVTTTPAGAGVTIDGPDVSAYQHPSGASINWAAVAKSGHEFAIVKATEGTSYVNKYFKADYAGIRNAGMVRGSYHFAHPAYPVAATALAQARFYVSRIGSTKTTRTLPPALDLEVSDGLSRPALIAWAQAFLLDVRNLTGRTPMLYTYPYFWQHSLGDNVAFQRYPLWMATYHGSVDAGATLWQYTAGAKVSGIKGGVDMSRVLADPATWAVMSDGTQATPWPATAPGVPAAVHVSPAVGAVSVRWLPPDAGTSPVTSYRVTVARADGLGTPTSVLVGASRVTVVVRSLSRGIPYVATVRAHNAVGSGPDSSPRTVVPQHPVSLIVSGPRTLGYGAVAALSAVVRQSDSGAPLAGVRVSVASRAVGAVRWVSHGTLTTDAQGRVSRTFTPGRNDDFQFRYGGGTGLAPAAGVRTVTVRPTLAARLTAATTTPRHAVVLIGHVTPAESGARIVSEVRSGGHWRVLEVKRTGAHGGYRFVLVTKTTGTSTYRVVLAASRQLLGATSPRVVLKTVAG